MAKDTEPLEMLNKNANRTVKQAERVIEETIDQTRGARDNYLNFMQKAFSSYPVAGTELADKMRSYTEQNISAAQEFVQKLSRAKDFQDIIRIQIEFMEEQFSVCTEQTKGLAETFTKAATSAAKLP
jgi:hypothetical protein